MTQASSQGSGPTITGRSRRSECSSSRRSPAASRNTTAGFLRTMSQAVENSSRRPSLAGCVIAAWEKYERQ